MIAQETYKCGKCGICLTTCPVYRELRDETGSPRAKVQLLKHYAENSLSTSPYLAELFNRCLMCGACTVGCPSGVRHDLLYMQMRDCMVSDFGEAWRLKVLFHLLSHETQLRFAAKFAGMSRNVLLPHLNHEIKIGNIQIRRLPAFNAKPFRDQMPEYIIPRRKPVGTVLYFTGCATNYVFEGIGHAVVAVLTAMGFRVQIPKGQVCCGLPMFFHGNMEQARRNIQANIGVLNQPDIVAVVTDCASCGSALRCEYSHIMDALNLPSDPARAVGRTVKDISEFILENFSLLKPALQSKNVFQSVTYHAPCHLRNVQGVVNEIESLLFELPNVSYLKVPDVNACCGGGGTFFYEFL